MKIDLHIFTNATVYAPRIEVIKSTYQSFVSAFGNIAQPIVWCDPKPNLIHADKYISNLKEYFNDVRVTESLSDGYIQSINQSSADFMFMLEHDWEFIKSNIHHSLDEICNTMTADKLIHFRFNKRQNIAKGWDTKLTEVNSNVTYCLTPCVSNNPHIIKRDLYTKHALKYIVVDSGSHGIEHKLQNIDNIRGAIYGSVDYPQTVSHTDGRNR
jgi:hypothetical protein